MAPHMAMKYCISRRGASHRLQHFFFFFFFLPFLIPFSGFFLGRLGMIFFPLPFMLYEAGDVCLSKVFTNVVMIDELIGCETVC